MRLARLAYEDPEVPTIGEARLHVFLNLGDHLGSTSIVIDQATSELVEASRYQAYGGAESDYRPERWKGFREDYRFTGKEEDVEVGLQYFGKRFLNPLLGRWVSADPLAVHIPGKADLNVYAYVRGAPLKNVDPWGLQETSESSAGAPGYAPSGEGGAHGAAGKPSPIVLDEIQVTADLNFVLEGGIGGGPNLPSQPDSINNGVHGAGNNGPKRPAD